MKGTHPQPFDGNTGRGKKKTLFVFYSIILETFKK
jgi:hypothetical protein